MCLSPLLLCCSSARQIKFQDPSVKMYWLAESEPAGAECAFHVDSGRACGFSYDQTCAVQLGTFSGSESFEVAALHKKDKLLDM